MGIKKKKQYQLLYLPAGKLVEVLDWQAGKISMYQLKWHVPTRNRTDLQNMLTKIINRGYALNFYERNEMPNADEGRLYHCHFIFVRYKSTESE